MKKHSPKFLKALEAIDSNKEYSVKEALETCKNVAFAKFDETVDLAFRLGVDPRHADQMIRGALVMPAGTGKDVKVLVITSGENITLAESAGADFIGGDDMITKISGGWLEFDRVIATPDMMGKIGRIGRVLGPRGLMPNPKLGTVTTDVTKAVQEQKSGKIEYRTDKTGIVHVQIGKKSFSLEQLEQNFRAISTAIIRAKPVSSKGTYLKSLSVSTTMGPGISMNAVEVMNSVI